MISLLKLHNFRSYTDAEIPMGVFTVVVGANGHGKSNIIRALQWLIGNQGTWGSIPKTGTKGKDEVSVTADIDGVALTRLRSVDDRTNAYEYTHDGQTDLLDKVGRGDPPPAIQDIVTLAPKGGKDTALAVQIASQHADPFMLTATSGELEAQFSALVGLEAFHEATATIQTNLRNLQRDSAAQGPRIESWERALIEYAELPRLSSTLDSAEVLDTTLFQRNAESAHLVELSTSWISLHERVSISAEKSAAVAEATQRAEQALATLKNLYQAYEQAVILSQGRARLTTALEGRIEALKRLQTAQDACVGLLGALESKYREAEEGARLWNACFALRSDLSQIEEKVELAAAAQAKTETELAKFDTCPACGRPF